MSTDCHLIALPLPPRILSPNVTVGSIGGRMAKASAVKKYRAMAQLATLSVLGGVKPRWKTADIRVHWFHKTMRFPDGDNTTAHLKAAFDGMTDAGLFADDRGLRHYPVEFSKDALYPRVEISVEAK